jgi:hypothetical protein
MSAFREREREREREMYVLDLIRHPDTIQQPVGQDTHRELDPGIMIASARLPLLVTRNVLGATRTRTSGCDGDHDMRTERLIDAFAMHETHTKTKYQPRGLSTQ